MYLRTWVCSFNNKYVSCFDCPCLIYFLFEVITMFFFNLIELFLAKWQDVKSTQKKDNDKPTGTEIMKTTTFVIISKTF